MVKSIATTVWSGLVRAWRFWMNDINKRKSVAGKAVSICIGLFIICCVCAVPINIINGPRKNTNAVAIAPTTTSAATTVSAVGSTKATEAPTSAPTIQPTSAPIQTPTPEPTATPQPTQTPVPTLDTAIKDYSTQVSKKPSKIRRVLMVL